MKSLGLSRYALTIGAAAALLAGCGGSQPPLGAPGAMPETSAIARAAARGKSWMLPEAKSQDLIYAEGSGCGGVCILSYPDGSVEGSIADSNISGGDCSDGDGNVFVTSSSEVHEFAHGGTTPIATFSLPGTEALGCGVDATTGNLAVTFTGSGANVAVFAGASPTLYETNMVNYYCGYDSSGNLFVSGLNGHSPALAELPSGGSVFTFLSITGNLGAEGQVQWDGSYLTYEGRDTRHVMISRLQVSGSTAAVVGTTQLKGPASANQTWIAGNRVIVPYSTKALQINKIGLWKYPKSGKVATKFGTFGAPLSRISGVTLSVAPPH